MQQDKTKTKHHKPNRLVLAPTRQHDNERVRLTATSLLVARKKPAEIRALVSSLKGQHPRVVRSAMLGLRALAATDKALGAWLRKRTWWPRGAVSSRQ